jgi:hypothetical protein
MIPSIIQKHLWMMCHGIVQPGRSILQGICKATLPREVLGIPGKGTG